MGKHRRAFIRARLLVEKAKEKAREEAKKGGALPGVRHTDRA